MQVHRVIALLVCLIPVGGAAVWLEAYRFRLEQRITELSDRADQLEEIRARLRAQLATEAAPAFMMAVQSGSEKRSDSSGPSEAPLPSWPSSPRLGAAVSGSLSRAGQ